MDIHFFADADAHAMWIMLMILNFMEAYVIAIACSWLNH